MAAKFTVPRGTTYFLTHVFYVNKVATSVAGCTLHFTLKAKQFDSDPTDSTALIVKDVFPGNHYDETNGVDQIELTPVDTQIAPGTYYYDFKIKTADGKEYLTQSGQIVISGSPTNRD